MISVKICPSLKLVIFRVIGSVTVEEIVEILNINILKPEWEIGYSILIDQREMTSAIPLSAYENLQSFANSFDKCRNVKQAVIVDTHLKDVMAREWVNSAENTDLLYNIFFDLPEAAEWLGIQADMLDSLEEAMGGEGNL